MTRSLLRATTALTLTLSLLQPTHLPAQTLGEALEALEQLTPEEMAEWQALCTDDPRAEGCETFLRLQEEAEAEVEAEAEAEAEVEAEAESEPEAEVEPEVEAEVEAESAPQPEAAAEVEAEADEVIEEPAEAVVEDPEAAPEADVAEEVIEAPAEDTAEDTADSPLDALPDEDAVVEETEADAPVELEAEVEADAEAEAEVVTEADEPVESEAEAAAETEAEAESETAAESEMEAEAETAAGVEADAEVVVEAEESAPLTDEDRDASATLLEDPEVAEAAETLGQALSAQELDDAVTDDTDEAPLTGAAAALAALLAGTEDDATAPAAEATEVQETTLTEETTRSSGEEFDTGLTAQVDTTRRRDRGMSDLERAGLVALGALAVGVILSNGNRVVASSGDRVVVDRGDGSLALWKDDDALLRQPGANQRVERFADGSTITRLDRADGTQIITIRDATGRVLRRARVELDGSQTLLIDDTRRFQPVEVSRLPPPRMSEVRITEGTDPALVRALLQAAEQPEIGRSFSLRQVRETQPLRELAPEITGNPILFATGSSAVRADEAPKLLQLGRLMQDLIADNPREMFLIEGHTDATGPASFNLALSDRRAESVALALTEYFGVPPENMVVQGYGEEYLKIPTQAAEPENRRVAVRRVTWLIAQR